VLNLPLGLLSTLLSVLPAGYGLLLMLVEHRSDTIRDGMISNLFAALPGQALVSAYVYLSVADTTPARVDWRGVPLVLIFIGILLHFEFARKTSWRTQPGTRMYSQVLGPVGAAAATLALAAATAGLTAAVFGPTNPVGLLPAGWMVLVAAAGGWRFLRHHGDDWPLLPPMLFVLGSLVLLIVTGWRP
jgi:hypothetical protein